jgi:hypothetical protein
MKRIIINKCPTRETTNSYSAGDGNFVEDVPQNHSDYDVISCVKNDTLAVVFTLDRCVKFA